MKSSNPNVEIITDLTLERVYHLTTIVFTLKILNRWWIRRWFWIEYKILFNSAVELDKQVSQYLEHAALLDSKREEISELWRKADISLKDLG